MTESKQVQLNVYHKQSQAEKVGSGGLLCQRPLKDRVAKEQRFYLHLEMIVDHLQLEEELFQCYDLIDRQTGMGYIDCCLEDETEVVEGQLFQGFLKERAD